MQTKKNRATKRPARLYMEVINIKIIPHVNVKQLIHFDELHRLINKIDGTPHKI